jgi:serine/threonine protein kinase
MLKIITPTNGKKCFDAEYVSRLRHNWNRLFEAGLAPRLYFLKQLTPSSVWTLIISEWCDSASGFSTLNDTLKTDLSDADRENLQACVLGAVDRMHRLNLVHGDLRACNIMVRRREQSSSSSSSSSSSTHNWEVRLIDFDWMEAPGVATYPLNLNTSIGRAPGAKSGAYIAVEHDIGQVKLEFRRPTNK